MGATYQSISWNRQKKLYDLLIAGFVVLYLTLFISFTAIFNPEVTQETLVIRSSATLALIMLHLILMIGPMARLHPLFLPLLYNRRHLGVAFFVVCGVHGVFSVLHFHSQGNINPILSVFQSNTHYASYTKFPFEIFGFFALILFFMMAITSHDFWLQNLGPRFWKSLHMCVYAGYALIIFHVLLGILQNETSPVFIVSLGIGMVMIITLHLTAGFKSYKADKVKPTADLAGFLNAGDLNDIPENRARLIVAGDEKIAVFRYGNNISAVSNVCKHQQGPLGEGKIIDGCITCPWHGYQYFPHNGCSPPPFTEKLATYDVKIVKQQVWINPVPYPEGTERPAAIIENC